MISSTTGAIINKYEYNPFGALAVNSETVDNPFKFSSEYNEKETGLVYYNYRFYDPSTGKWLSRDPIQEDGGANIYAMLGADPINYFDLFGLKEEKCTVVVIWGHNYQVMAALRKFNKNIKGNYAVASGLGCNIDGRNIGHGIEDSNDENFFPNCSAEQIGFSPEAARKDGNGGFNDMMISNRIKRGTTGFARLMHRAWRRAKLKANAMAEDCNCECSSITLEFRGVSYDNKPKEHKGKPKHYRRNGILNYRYSTSQVNGAYEYDKDHSKKDKNFIAEFPKAGMKYTIPCKKNAKK